MVSSFLAQLRFQQGNDSGLQETLRRMAQLGPQHAACSEAYQALFTLKRTTFDLETRSSIEAWAHKYIPQEGPIPSNPFALGIGIYHCDAEYFYNLAWAKVQIAHGHPEKASVFIEPALKSANDHGILFRVVELSIEQALIHDLLGNPSAALVELANALEIAEEAGFTQVFNDGPQLDHLLLKASENDMLPNYARQLLASFHRHPPREGSNRPLLKQGNGQQPLVEPLSARELEVLRHLENGVTLPEISKRLYLSYNTLKAHTQNIYSKLDVHTRIEAINRARELGLI